MVLTSYSGPRLCSRQLATVIWQVSSIDQTKQLHFGLRHRRLGYLWLWKCRKLAGGVQYLR